MFEKIKNIFFPVRKNQPYDNAEIARKLTNHYIEESYLSQIKSIEGDIDFAILIGRFFVNCLISRCEHKSLIKEEFEKRGFQVVMDGNILKISWD